MYFKKNILVINGTKGLGIYICKYFISKQFRILLLDSSLNNLNKYANFFNNSSQSTRVFPFFCNFYNDYQLDSLFRYIKINFKTIDFILNNNVIFSNFCFVNKKENFFNIVLRYFFYIVNYYRFLYKFSFLNKDIVFYNIITSVNKQKENVFIFNFLNKNYQLFNNYFYFLNKKYNFNNINFFISGEMFKKKTVSTEMKIFNLFESCFSIFFNDREFISKRNNYFIKF